MSFKPWITVPAEDIRIELPLSLYDDDIRIMFKDEEAIDKTIEQLQNLKELMGDRRINMNV